jgi:Ni/Co efflux regulator RcnB
MRKLTIFILLATAGAPALAQADEDRGDRRQRGQSTEQSESRSQRSSEGRRSGSGEQRSSQAARSEPSQAKPQGAIMQVREHHREQRRQAASTPSDTSHSVGVVGPGAGVSGSQTPTNWRARERRVRTIPDTQPVTTRSSTSQREALLGGNRRDYRDGKYDRWSNNWRHDRRYDWRGHRNRHRSAFRLGFYYDPFGWNYRRWSIGSYLYPSYYRSSFWMNDPWQYRLPPAYGPYRWVRYWNDALLVNTYTGEVVDVIHGFFW